MSYSSYLDNPFASSEDMFLFAQYITNCIHIARIHSREASDRAENSSNFFEKNAHFEMACSYRHEERAYRNVWRNFLDALDTYAKYEIFEKFAQMRSYRKQLQLSCPDCPF